MFDAATAVTAAGVMAHRAGALERAHLALADLADIRAEIAVVEARMVAVLDELGLTALVTTIAGLSPIGAAAILAETGDPTRFSLAAGAGQARRAVPARQLLGRPTRARPLSAAAAGPSCAWPPGGRCGPRCANNPVLAARFTLT